MNKKLGWVSCFTYWASINRGCITTISAIGKVNATLCNSIITPSTVSTFRTIKINPVSVYGKRVINILLALTLQIKVFFLQCSIRNLQVGNLHLQIGDFNHKFGIINGFCQFINRSSAGNNWCKEFNHV